MKTIVFVEYNNKGHHPVYVKWLAKTALDMGYRIIVACPNPAEILSWIKLNSPSGPDRFNAYPLSMPNASLFSFLTVLARWFQITRLLKKIRYKDAVAVDLVFFNHVEDFLLMPPYSGILPFFINFSWAGLLLQPWRRLTGRDNRNSNTFALLNASFCQGVAAIDETAIGPLAEYINREKLFLAPDFADTSLPVANSPMADEIEQRANGRLCIGLFGFLKKYKGLLTFIEVAKRANPAQFFFVVAGELAPEGFSAKESAGIRAFAQERPENCFFCFERIADEAEYNALVNGVDVVFAVFEGFAHSSNTLAKAAAFKKPVIVSKGFCMEHRVREYRLGEVIESGSASQCHDVLSKMGKGLDAYIQSARFSEYSETHSVMKWKPLFRKMLKE